jgi:hypothetical protein
MKMKSICECELTRPNVKHLLFGLRALQTSIKSFLSIYFFDGVIMTLKVSEPERGPGLWKMNYTVIQTDLFKHIFESFWNKWKLQKNNFKK